MERHLKPLDPSVWPDGVMDADQGEELRVALGQCAEVLAAFKGEEEGQAEKEDEAGLQALELKVRRRLPRTQARRLPRS